MIKKQPSTIYLIGRFIQKYGHDYYYSDRWTTHDKIIPFKLFFMMLNALGHIDAAQQLQDVFATAHGQAMVQSGKELKVKTATKNLIRAANPEVL